MLAAAAAPARLHAQQPPKAARVAVFAGKPDLRFRATFAGALRELGWTEGKNLAIDWRAVEHPDGIPKEAADLARLKPHVIVTGGPRITQEMAKAAPETPIVFLAVGNPEKMGLVRSLAQPGGNVTGLRTAAGDGLPSKLLELLKEAIPNATRLGAFIVTGNATHQGFVRMAKEAAPKLGVALDLFDLSSEKDIEPAFESAKRAKLHALVVLGDVLINTNQERVIALALKHRLPTMFSFSYYADAGGLMSYGVNIDGLYRDAARMADKILRGAKPADIPVEQPTRYELVVNLKTATALGLAVPRSLLQRADRVIE